MFESLIVDQNPHWDGMLSGRALPLEVYPFSLAEYTAGKGVVSKGPVAAARERNRPENRRHYHP